MISSLEPEIIKTLDRLTFFSSKGTPAQSISPFYHAANTLMKYAETETSVQKKQKYFNQFYQMFEKFSQCDFSKIKKHHQQILDEIVQIIESETFIECLRPDLHNIRHLRNSLRIEKIQMSPQEMEKYQTPYKMSKSQGSVSSESNSEWGNSNKQFVDESNITSQQKAWRQIKRLYEDHCLDEAYQKSMEYLTLLKNPNAISKQQSQLLKEISNEYETMINSYAELDKGVWEFQKEQNGISLQFKQDKQSGMIALRIQGEGQIPIQKFLAVVSEIDLMSDYVPFCYDCKQIKQIARNQRVGSSKIYVPLLNDREVIFYAAGYDRMKHKKSIFFFNKTINNDKVLQLKHNFKIPEQSSKYVRLQYKFFIVEYIPLDLQRAKIRIASKIDMKINVIPRFIIFKSAKIFAFDYFKNLMDRIKKFKGSPWQKRVKEHPQIYKFFRRKIDGYKF